MASAFEGIKVLDFSWFGVGPITAKYLGDHGATVVRIESVSRPDGLRAGMPFKDAQPGINRSGFAANYNTNKYGLGLNLSKPEGRELVKRLIAKWQPDVLVESFTPKAMPNWGLDYPNVKEIKPDIIYLSTCQQGQTGPNAMYAGFGNLAASVAGFYHITGWPDREPVGPYGAYADFINPQNALAAVVAALEYRRRTGKGQYLDQSQAECASHFFAPAVMDYVVNGRVMGRRGNRDDVYVPHGVYPCAEPAETPAIGRKGGYWCAIAVTSDREWDALCMAMGEPPWCREDRFATFLRRKDNEDELDRLIGEWTPGYEPHDLMRRLQETGVPAGAVQSQSDLWEDPQLKHRDFFQWLEHSECGPMPYDGLQFILSKTPGKMRTGHAMIGEHNEMILKDFVGLTDEEMVELLLAEVLEIS